MPEPQKPGSAIRDFPEETICPSCGKFVGAYTRCPYCGAEHKRRTSIRFFRIFSICMSFGGLFIIWLAARGIQAPLIHIKDIGPTNAFAYVRIEGNNTRTRLFDDGGISFWVDDGTGTLMVRAYDDIGKMLWKENRVPGAGDIVSVEGTLNLREDFVMMIINIPEKVVIERVEPELVAIVNMDDDYIDEKALVEGKIVATRKFRKGSSVTLSDGTGLLDVVIWDSNKKMMGEKAKLLSIGQNVAVQGTVGKYSDRMQINLAFPADIRKLNRDVDVPADILSSVPAEAKGPEKPTIGEIDKSRVGDLVEVAGTVSGVQKFTKGTKFQLTDPTGSVEVILWDSVYDGIPSADKLIKDGSALSVRGPVGEYKGKLQVAPKSSDQVKPSG